MLSRVKLVPYPRVFKEWLNRWTLSTLQVAACNIRVELVNDTYTHLRGEIMGPPDTPYEGGIFHLEIKIPETYPFNPPLVSCLLFVPEFSILWCLNLSFLLFVSDSQSSLLFSLLNIQLTCVGLWVLLCVWVLYSLCLSSLSLCLRSHSFVSWIFHSFSLCLSSLLPVPEFSILLYLAVLLCVWVFSCSFLFEFSTLLHLTLSSPLCLGFLLFCVGVLYSFASDFEFS